MQVSYVLYSSSEKSLVSKASKKGGSRIGSQTQLKNRDGAETHHSSVHHRDTLNGSNYNQYWRDPAQTGSMSSGQVAKSQRGTVGSGGGVNGGAAGGAGVGAAGGGAGLVGGAAIVLVHDYEMGMDIPADQKHMKLCRTFRRGVFDRNLIPNAVGKSHKVQYITNSVQEAVFLFLIPSMDINN